MEKISIQEIATVLIEKNGLKRKEAEQFVLTMFDLIKESLATDRVVKVKGLGTFKVVDIEARESVNVNTGERVLIEGHDKITFTPDNTMKELVNKPFSQFETVVLNEGVTFDDMPETEGEEPEAPEAAEIVAVPEVAETPVVVVVPKSPAVPDSPEILDNPENLESPDIPEVKDAEPEPEPEPEIEPVPESGPVLAFFESEENMEEPVEETAEQSTDEVPTEDDAPTEDEYSTDEAPTDESPIEETTIDDNIEETEEEYMSKKMTYISLVIAILFCVLCFVGGYYYGSNVGNKAVADNDTIESKVTPEVIDTAVTDSVKADTIELKAAEPEEKAETEAVAEEKAEEKAEAKPEVKAEPKPEPKPEVKTEPKPEATSVTPDKYDQMDSRVRTGAYRIVGNDYSTKVKAGETLPKIARRTLGPDMECYIEVFNGIKSSAELKEGQSIKIPKLELKKKKKANN